MGSSLERELERELQLEDMDTANNLVLDPQFACSWLGHGPGSPLRLFTQLSVPSTEASVCRWTN